MSEHLSEQTIEQYHRRQLAPEVLLSADDHLATCTECRRQTSEGLHDERGFTSLRSDLHSVALQEWDHLSDEQMMAFVDEELDSVDLEIVESHLEICKLCRAEVEDLAGFREELAKSQVAVPASQITVARPQSFAFLRGLFLSRPSLQLAAIAVVTLVLMTVGLLIWTTKRSSNESIAVAPPPTAVSPIATVEASPSVSPPVSDTNESQVALSLNDGSGRVTLDTRGNIAGLETLPASVQQAVHATLTNKRVQTPELKGLAGKSEVLLGGSAEGVAFPLLSPIGIVVRTDHPTLRWQPLNGATSYTATIFDENFNVIVTSQPLKANQWTVTRELKRGRIYSWQVTAVKDGVEIISPHAPAPEARFKVLDRQRSAELDRVEAARTASHLALGVAYAQAGLLNDAEREFRELLKLNPESPVAHQLLRSVQTVKLEK